MSAFAVFTLVFTLCLLAYYAIMIALDIRKMGKRPSAHTEEFDVSYMQEETAQEIKEAVGEEPQEQVSEKVSVTIPEEHPIETQVVQQPPIPTPPPPSAAEKKVEKCKGHLVDVPVTGSAELTLDEFSNLLFKGEEIGPKFGIPSK